MTRVLVTGGSGFLGNSVVPALAERCERVVSADVRASGAQAPPPGGPEPDARAAVAAEHVDVTDPAAVSAVIARHRIDTVVHLASIVTPPPGMTAAEAYRVDVGGADNVIAACIDHGVRRLVVSSSGAAYGYHPDNPARITEDQPLRGNDAFAYARHKRIVEEHLARARRQHPELHQTILRIGTILGERVDNQITALFSWPRLLRIAGSDSPFVFVWDTDLTAILVRAATGESARVRGVFNVAGSGTLTIAEIAQRLGKRTVTVPEPLLRAALATLHRARLSPYGPEQTAFLRYRPVLDNTRLIDGFGYTPRYSTTAAFDAWARAHR